MRRAASCLILLAGLLPAPGSVSPALAEEVDLELILAVDISGSIDHAEALLQRRGYLKALVDPRVVRAITGGERRRIAITYMEWAGGHYQNVVAGWTVVRDRASARAFAEAVAGKPVTTEGHRSARHRFCLGSSRQSESRMRKVLDISERPVKTIMGRPARRRHGRVRLKAGVAINGLPTLEPAAPTMGNPPPKDSDGIISTGGFGGPGGFCVVARFQELSATPSKARSWRSRLRPGRLLRILAQRRR